MRGGCQETRHTTRGVQTHSSMGDEDHREIIPLDQFGGIRLPGLLKTKDVETDPPYNQFLGRILGGRHE